MHTWENFIVVIMIIGLILAGCTPTKTPGVSLDGTSWVLTGVKGGPALSGATVTIEFSNGRISGSDGCNSYSGSVTLKGNKFNVGKDIISTMMACSDPIMQQSSAFYDALKQSTAYKVVDQQLTLLDASGQIVAAFTKQSSQPGETPASVAPATVTPVVVAPAILTPETTAQATATAAPVMSATQTPQGAGSIAQALPNAEYPVEGVSTGKAQLKNGVFEEAAAPGSATKIRVQLGVQQALGDVNGDGTQDAAVTLVVDPGGSGIFTYLALVLNDQGTAKPVASIFLGDRIVVKSLAIQSGSILVVMLTRQADQPMSADPTFEVARTFQLQGDKLVEVNK
jgi:heat shock protein HslJ